MTTATQASPKTITQWIRDCGTDLHGAGRDIGEALGLIRAIRADRALAGDPVAVALILDRVELTLKAAQTEVASAGDDLRIIAGKDCDSAGPHTPPQMFGAHVETKPPACRTQATGR